MSDTTKLKTLKVLMIAVGIFSVVGVPVAIILWPAGWIWEPSQPDYEGMIAVIYLGFALCLFWAVRNPVRHIIIVWGFILSSILHGGFMAYLALTQENEIQHLWGDVLFNFFIVALFLIFMPWGMLREQRT